MNRIITGLTALIAILAMSFTIATRTSSLKNNITKSSEILSGCYTSFYIAHFYDYPYYTTVFYSPVFNAPYVPFNQTINLYDIRFPLTINQFSTYIILTDYFIGNLIFDPNSDCPWTVGAPVCCYGITTTYGISRVTYIRFGVFQWW